MAKNATLAFVTLAMAMAHIYLARQPLLTQIRAQRRQERAMAYRIGEKPLTIDEMRPAVEIRAPTCAKFGRSITAATG